MKHKWNIHIQPPPARLPSRQARGVCPLCERVFPASRLHEASPAEPARVRAQIIEAIRADHPGWVESDGACPKCWEAFRGVVRVARFIKHYKFPNRV